jgi:hypothetical protein
MINDIRKEVLFLHVVRHCSCLHTINMCTTDTSWDAMGSTALYFTCDCVVALLYFNMSVWKKRKTPRSSACSFAALNSCSIKYATAIWDTLVWWYEDKTGQAVLDRINISILHSRSKSVLSDMCVTALKLFFGLLRNSTP